MAAPRDRSPADVVADVRAAVAARDLARLRLLLHPHLHWTGRDGVVVRGRTRVLALLTAAPSPEPPSAVELRDGQVYRWTG